MTRKHFRALASALAACAPPAPIGAIQSGADAEVYAKSRAMHARIVEAVARACAEFNPAFDRQTFLAAAGVSDAR